VSGRAHVSSKTAKPSQTLHRELARSTGQPLDHELVSEMATRHWPTPTVSASRQGRSAYNALERGADEAMGEQHGEAGRVSGQFASAGGGVPRIDFSSVRLHADAGARGAAQQLGARAFTIGQHIYVDPARVGSNRRATLTHELAHVVQQRQLGRTFIQPQLIATGSDADVNRFLTMAGAGMGEHLVRDPVTHAVTANASSRTPALSPAFTTSMHRIMDDAAQNAEVHFGTHQDGVAVGAFPDPSDMTGPTEQRIDMDDVQAIERGAPGSGYGKLAHEINENYDAHATAPVAGVDAFPLSHEVGLAAESDVTEETVGPGRRVAGVDTPTVANAFTRVQDFENYYLVFNLTGNPLNNDFTVSRARQAPRVNLSRLTIDHYVTGSDAVPATGAANIAAAVALVAANDTATVRIEGFTDDVGTANNNVNLGQDRADTARRALRNAGVDEERVHAVGEGETNFVAPNDTEANRARNRRVVIIIDRPGP
jgi:outer membrane protein OmpA-like peptidoglycan-associated protein